MKHKILKLVFGVATLLLYSAAWAGPVFLTGHDPDFHAQGNAGARNLLRSGLAFVTGSTYVPNTNFTPAQRFLWVESRVGDPGLPGVPGGHLIGEDGLTAIGLTLGTDYDRANAAELAAIDFSSYSAIAIASSFGGLLRRVELDALIARADDIEDFVNAGGGLFAASECDGCGADLLGVDPDLFGYLPIDVSSIGAAGPFNPTAVGAAAPFLLTFGDLNSPTHNSFGLTGGLDIIDLDNAGNPTTLAGVVKINGGFVPVAEPTTLALLGLALLGLGLGRRKIH